MLISFTAIHTAYANEDSLAFFSSIKITEINNFILVLKNLKLLKLLSPFTIRITYRSLHLVAVIVINIYYNIGIIETRIMIKYT